MQMCVLLNIKEKVSFFQVSYTKQIYNRNNIKEKVLVPVVYILYTWVTLFLVQ